jgi:hypothetical protein
MLDHLPLVWYNVLAVSHICSMTLASIQKNRQILYEVLVVARNIDTSLLTYFHILFIYSQTWLNPLCGYMITTWATSQNWKRTKHRLREWKTQL